MATSVLTMQPVLPTNLFIWNKFFVSLTLLKLLLLEQALLERQLLLSEGLLALGLDLVLHHGEVLLLGLHLVCCARKLAHLGLLAAKFLPPLAA